MCSGELIKLLEKFRQKKWLVWVLAISLVLLTLTARICVAYFLASDEPGDGVIYSHLAKNILEQNVYSLDEQAPFTPTLVRLPGYPLFIAAVYSVFGHDNNTAVRIVQAIFDTASCVIVALLALLWSEEEKRKRKNALWAFGLAALCPFIVIYSATLLTETLTTFLMAAMTLTATLALKTMSTKKSLFWWSFTGLGAGAAVLLRPDSGLFAAGIGLTLVVSHLFLKTENSGKFLVRFLQVVLKGSVLSLTFILVLAPWTIRNYRLFGVIRPLAPAHAEMPGDFVPLGYQHWLRTWVDDSRFIEPMLWNLGEKPIDINKIPIQNFDSPEERTRIAALLDQYNHPPGTENKDVPAKTQGDYKSGVNVDSGADNGDDSADDNSNSSDDNGDNSPDDNTNPDDEKNADTADPNSDNSADDQSDGDNDENTKYVVKMTPDIDAQFEQIADERIDHSPVRYYLFVPVRRAAALWFDSHSLYYPFGGQMSPVSDLDYDEYQQYWLPAFTLLTWFYTLLAIGGAFVLWRNRTNKNMLRWLILISLVTLPRIAFFASIENPEPRYVVELFVFAAILGGFFLGNLKLRRSDSEETSEPEPSADRLVSLDVFRGITIAAMTLVNDPGSWSAIYPPLAHAEWNGATPTDWIFPFFLFIVGVSITFALGKRIDERSVDRQIYFKIFKRTAMLFALGIFLEIFPFYNIWTASWFEPSTLRIMGVLQRIAVCYLVASLIFLHTNWKRQAFIAIAILLGYWAVMTLINVPGCEITTFNDKTCNLAAYLDRTILTENHIWNQSKVFDPEGLLSTIPAIATTVAGVLAGQWMRSARNGLRKCAGMFFGGIVFTIVGWVWSFWFPLNKSLWTSSYVVYTAGLALCFLAICYWVIDLKGYRKWSIPFLIFGSNAIALYVGSTIVGTILNIVQISAPHDEMITLQEKIFSGVFLPLAAPVNASLLYAVSFVLIWLFFLWPLYRKKIFLKI